MGRRKKKRSITLRLLRGVGIIVAVVILLSVAAVLPFRWYDPPYSSMMLQDDSGRVPVLHEWSAWSDIADSATLAVVAAEDQKFADHFGFDLQSLKKAIESYEDGGSLRGASTITQQVAKNMYLWPGRSFVRKGLEAWFTLLIELCWSKQRIVEIYLNVAELGPGIYGVPAASRYYFGRTAAEISDAQAALLAAVLPNPARLQVDNPSAYVRERQRWIQSQMRRLQREQWITLLK